MREKSELEESKTKRLVKPVNFTKKDKYLYDKLDKMENYSAYIVELIRKDVERGGHDKFQKILDELSEIKGIITSGNVVVDTKQNIVSDQLKNKMYKALDTLFDEEE